MPKTNFSLSSMQLVSEAVNRCYTADVDDFRFRLELAQFKKAVNDHLGAESAFAETRRQAFQKYGQLSEDGQNYSVPSDPEKMNQFVKAIESAMSVEVVVPFPEITMDKLENLKLPLNAAELAVLISTGVLKEE